MSSPVCGAGSLARTGHEPPKRFNIDWNGFREYLGQRYNNDYAKACYRYARKYQHLIDNPSMLETFNKWMKNNVMKSLIAFSKYHGFYLEFKDKIKSYGIK